MPPFRPHETRARPTMIVRRTFAVPALVDVLFPPVIVIVTVVVALFATLCAGQNVAITSTGIAVATRGNTAGLALRVTATNRAVVQTDLPPGVTSFDDVSIDAENESLLFALSVESRTVCSYQITRNGGGAAKRRGVDLVLVGCYGGNDLSVSPFVGISAVGGIAVVSGGTGGLSVLAYDASTGALAGRADALNRQLNGIIGLPDVVMIDRTMAAFSVDFVGSPRFGTLIASIDAGVGVGASVAPVREYRIPGALGFANIVQPANFPLVSAVYRPSAEGGGGGVYLYTAGNGPMTVQDLSSDGTSSIVIMDPPDGFVAITVAVNHERKLAVFGGLLPSSSTANGQQDGVGDISSMIITYDISSNPTAPVFSETFMVQGRITSVASSGNVIVHAVLGGVVVGEVDGEEIIATSWIGGTAPTANPTSTFAPTEAPTPCVSEDGPSASMTLAPGKTAAPTVPPGRPTATTTGSDPPSALSPGVGVTGNDSGGAVRLSAPSRSSWFSFWSVLVWFELSASIWFVLTLAL